MGNSCSSSSQTEAEIAADVETKAAIAADVDRIRRQKAEAIGKGKSKADSGILAARRSRAAKAYTKIVLRVQSLDGAADEVSATVQGCEMVAQSLNRELRSQWGDGVVVRVLHGGREVQSVRWEETDVEGGAVVRVVWLWTEKKKTKILTREQVEALVNIVTECNAGADKAQLLSKAEFDRSGNLTTRYARQTSVLGLSHQNILAHSIRV